MKKALLFFIPCTFLFLPAWVRAQAPPPENQRWIEQADGGFVFPLSPGVAQEYARGVGGDILVGYRFNRDFNLSADVGYFECDEKFYGGASGSWTYDPLLLLARFNFGPGWVRPFLLLGAGLAVDSYSLTTSYEGQVSNRETDPMLSPGAGVLFIVETNVAIYLQTRVDLIFSRVGGPWTDNPTVFLPIKAGLSVLTF